MGAYTTRRLRDLQVSHHWACSGRGAGQEGWPHCAGALGVGGIGQGGSFVAGAILCTLVAPPPGTCGPAPHSKLLSLPLAPPLGQVPRPHWRRAWGGADDRGGAGLRPCLQDPSPGGEHFCFSFNADSPRAGLPGAGSAIKRGSLACEGYFAAGCVGCSASCQFHCLRRPCCPACRWRGSSRSGAGWRTACC